MTRTLAISETGLRLIKAFEGFRPEDRILVTGVRVVGYGHRLDLEDDPILMDRDDAQEQLLEDLESVELLINEEIHAPLTQGQYDALCSLAFNIGLEKFRESEIVRALNNGRVLDAANGFDIWRKATVNGQTYVVDALMRRRTAEKSLFLRNEPAVPAPSAMLSPEADADAPLGPTDEGLPRAARDDDHYSIPGVIDAANIVNAETLNADVSEVWDEDDADEDFIDPDEYESDDTLLLDDVIDDDDIEDDHLVVSYRQTEVKEGRLVDHDPFDDVLLAEFGLTEDDGIDSDSIAIIDTSDLDDSLMVDGGFNFETGPESESESESEPDSEPEPEFGQDSVTDAQNDALPEASPTMISDAADSLGERLSALLDSDASTEADQLESDASDPALSLIAEDTALPSETLVTRVEEAEQRSNLVSFPRRERVMPDPVEPETFDPQPHDDEADAPVAEDIEVKPLFKPESTAMDAVSAEDVSVPYVKRIDDLAADDVIRAGKREDAAVFDPEGNASDNALRYLERKAAEAQEKKSSGFLLWLPVLIGVIILGASAAATVLGGGGLPAAWGPAAIAGAAITGGLTVVFGLYAVVRSKMAGA